ncbi:hypothetical protein ACFL23_02925 [Patescibacteria group bacterium]
MRNIKLRNLIFLVLIAVCLMAFSGCGKVEDSGDVVVETANGTEEVVGTDEIDTSDWKTYRNEEYGFELMYPEGWSLFFPKSNVNMISFNVGITESAESIEIKKNINNVTFEELKEQKIKFYELVTLTIDDLTIDGEEAIRIETSEFGTIRIFFLHNKFMYEITTGGRMEEGILDSFKFID